MLFACCSATVSQACVPLSSTVLHRRVAVTKTKLVTEVALFASPPVFIEGEAETGPHDVAEIFDLKGRRQAIQMSKTFGAIDPIDIERLGQVMEKIHFKDGANILAQGDQADAVYFVASGSFECYDEHMGKVHRIMNKLDVFEDLAFLLNQEVALSVRAASPNASLWRLDRKSFAKVISSDAKLAAIINALSDQTECAELVDSTAHQEALRSCKVFRKLAPNDVAYNKKKFDLDAIYQLLVVKSQPKKKPVSFHSTFSILGAGNYLSALLPLLKPGLLDERGLPHIFRIYDHRAPESVMQIQVGCWMLAISGAVMGLFRFPPKTPSARKRIFELGSATCLFLAAVISSSVNGLSDDSWWVDAFSIPGKCMLATFGLLMWISTFRLIDDTICGDTKGCTTIPGADNPVLAAVTYSVLCFFTLVSFAPVVPIFTSDAASYEASVSSVLVDNGIDGILLGATSTATGVSAFGALFATLQFEKKITPAQENILVLLLMFIFNVDGLVLLYQVTTSSCRTTCSGLAKAASASRCISTNFMSRHNTLCLDKIRLCPCDDWPVSSPTSKLLQRLLSSWRLLLMTRK